MSDRPRGCTAHWLLIDFRRNAMRLLSLGFDCKVAFHVRRTTGADNAYFFDWLMTPASALDVLMRPDADLLRPGRWELINEDSSVRDLDTGLMFMHEFPSVKTVGGPFAHRVLASEVERHLPVARAKFNHLRHKTLALIRSAPDLVLVRADEDLRNVDEALQQANRLRSLYLPLNPRLRFVVASTHLAEPALCVDTLLFNTAVGADWRGDFSSWDAAFRCAERLFEPVARAA